MSDFPFPYFNHGVLDPDYIGKSEELFLWFERELTADERQRVVRTCPKPVAGLFAWGDRFLYFGSHGDSYDVDILDTYGPPVALYDDEDSYAALSDAVLKFNEDLRRWAQEVHAMVPLAFFVGPHGAAKDDWGQWSEEQLDAALDQVVVYAGERPEILALLERPLDPDATEEELAEEARFSSYIFGAIARWDPQLVMGVAALDLLYATDGIWSPLSRLSWDEKKLHRNADPVSVYLVRGGAVDAESALRRLAPYTQLAYLASHGARRAEVLTKLDDPVAFVERLLSELPPRRAVVATSLVQMIADNQCQVGPAYEDPDQAYAELSAALLSLVQNRDDCPPEAFVHGAMYCEWSGAFADGVAVAEHGLARYPGSLELARAAVAVANLGGMTAEAATFSELVAELEASGAADPALLERSVVDQSFALVQAGEVDRARAVLVSYLEGGGDMSTDVWNNLMFTVCAAGPPTLGWAEIVARFMQELPDHEQWSEHENLLGSASAAFNENGFAVEAVELLDWAAGLTGGLATALLGNYVYSAYQTGEPDTMQRVADAVEAVFDRVPEAYDSAGLLENLAELRVALQQPQRAVALLRRLKELGHEDFASLRASEALDPLRERPDFLALFED